MAIGHLRAIIAAIFALLPVAAQAQPSVFPPTLPPNSVVGRLNTGSGPAQAIPFAILTGNLLSTISGDCTATLAGVITCTKTNNVAYGVLATAPATMAAHTVPVSVGGTPTAKAVPDCQDATGNHLNYTQSTDAFSCGTTNNVSTTYPLSGTGALTFVGPTTSGRLVFTSSTQVTFKPYNGDTIRISGVIYQIPNAGVSTGCTNAGLVQATLYYVYVFNNTGTLNCEISTALHLTDSTAGNIGTEFKSGDNSRSLVGMVFTDTGSPGIFADAAGKRYTATWFNRVGKGGSTNFTANKTTAGSTNVAEVDSSIRNTFVVWADEVINVALNAVAFPGAGATDGCYLAISFDGGTAEDAPVEYQPLVTTQPIGNLGMALWKSGLIEGNHYATLFGASTTANACTFIGSNTSPNAVGSRRTTLYVGGIM